MSDIVMLIKGTLKVVKYFFPAVVFIVFGLAYIAYDERRGERGQNKASN